MVFQQQIQLQTKGHRDMHDLTEQVGQVVGVRRGLPANRSARGELH
jgi:hypothetical protein